MGTFRQIMMKSLELRHSLASLTAFLYMFMSIFAAGNFILCFHEDGHANLEIVKSMQVSLSQSDIDAHEQQNITIECEEDECLDQELGSESLITKILAKHHTEAVKVITLHPIPIVSLLDDMHTEHDLRTHPPSFSSHFTIDLKPTISLLV